MAKFLQLFYYHLYLLECMLFPEYFFITVCCIPFSDHFLDEDSLLENLPKFEHCSGSGLPCELTRNSNWLQSKSPNAKLDFEIYGNDGYVSRQRKQILQARNIHRNTGITTCGANEGRSGGKSCTCQLQVLPLFYSV